MTKTETMLHIKGEYVQAEQLAFIISAGVNNGEFHAAVTEDLSIADNEVARTHQTAAFFSANTAVSLNKKVIDLIEVGNDMAIELAVELASAAASAHTALWNNHTAKSDGGEPPLPSAEELAALRAGIKQRYDAAVAAQQSEQTAVDALPVENPKRVTAELFADCVAQCVKEASSSIPIAMGEYKLELSDEELEQAISEFAPLVALRDDLTVDKARRVIEEQLGATVEERKAKLIAEQTAHMALNSQGTRDGALLSADKEVSLIEQGVALLQGYLNRPVIG